MFFTHLYALCITPRAQLESFRRREYILNLLLVGTLGLSGVSFGVALVHFLLSEGQYKGINLTVLLGVNLLFFLLLVLSRLRFHWIAAYIFIAIYYLAATYSLYRWGTILPTGLLLMALIIVMTGILIGKRAALGVTLLIGGTLGILNYFQLRGAITQDLHWIHESANADAFVFEAIFLLILLISWLYNREVESSLARAEQSEQALKEERDNLERIVVERTAELRQSQLEKTTQLYRFAHFGKATSGILHDLASPLTVVSLNLERLASNEASHPLKLALEGARRIEQFITTAREQVNSQKQYVLFSLVEEVKEGIKLVAHKAESAQVVLQFNYREDVEIYGSPVKIYQLIGNLVTNAIDAYESYDNQKKKKVSINLRSNPGLVHLIVQDWGKGIAHADQKKIFEPFFSTKSTEKGTGIGLAVCKEIVEEELKGRLTLESTPGKGSIFTIEIPDQWPLTS